MKKSKELKEIFKVSSTQKWYIYIFYALLFVIPGVSFFLIFIYIPPINLTVSFTLVVSGLLLPPVLYIFYVWFKNWKGKSIVVVTDSKIEFHWLKHLFLQINWSEVDVIKISGERWKYLGRGVKLLPIINSGFNLHFLGSNLNKSIKLWCFPYRYKQQGIIISGLIKFAEKMKKEIIIDESEKQILILNSNDPICLEFQNFYDKYRSK
jgi:hypothetical protein